MAKKLNCFQGLYPETNHDKPALSTSQLGYSQFQMPTTIAQSFSKSFAAQYPKLQKRLKT